MTPCCVCMCPQWLRDGRRVPVRVPEGCLFVQAGKQLEWLTGGDIQAGMHEVRLLCLLSTQGGSSPGESCPLLYSYKGGVLRPSTAFGILKSVKAPSPHRELPCSSYRLEQQCAWLGGCAIRGSDDV